MKMAKANKADLDMAMELSSALESLESHRSMPQALQDDSDDTVEFDADDAEDCKKALTYLLDLMGKGSLFRVVFGMCVLLDPRNRIVDQNSTALDHHPDVKRYEWLKENFATIDFKSGDNLLHVKNGDKPDHLDALIDQLRR
ncbi:MAG: hypothetical protein WC208_09705 [Gallionella sp.]